MRTSSKFRLFRLVLLGGWVLLAILHHLHHARADGIGGGGSSVSISTGRVNSALTGSIFSDDTPPAVISRIADRAMIGGAVVVDGKRFPVAKSWVGNYAPAGGFLTYFDSRSTFEVISQRGAVALATASRTSDMNPADTGSIGGMCVVLNDYLNATPSSRRSAWCNYMLAVRAVDTSTTGTGGTGGVSSTTFTFSPIPGTAPTSGSGITGTGFTQGTWITAYNGGTGVATLSQAATVANGTTVTFAVSGGAIAGGIQGIELDVANMGSVVDVDPYGGGTSQTGLTPGLLVSSGGEVAQSGTSVNPASAAMIVANNHAQFRKGIVIGSNAVYGTDGTTGTAPAVVMAKGHEIQWRFSGGDVTPAYSAVIRSDNNALSTLTKQIFRTNGVAFTDQFENQAFRVQPAATTVGQNTNYIAFLGAVAGSGTPAPTFAATGFDPTIGMDFQTNGRGQYNFYDLSKTRLLVRFNDAGSITAGGNSIILNANDAGVSPSVAAGGVDTNIDLTLSAKGTGSVVAAAPVRLKSYTVATLPACGASLNDAMAAVTDSAASPVYNNTVAGGGSTRVPVYCNGTNWTYH